MTKNILEWLEASCLKHPNKIAVADETAEMTYEELVKDAKILGTKLATYIQPRQAVAMYMEKGKHYTCGDVWCCLCGWILFTN